MISTRRSALRFRGSGEHLRLHVPRAPETMANVREVCRGSVALEKALGEAIRDAVAKGHSWAEIGHALGVGGTTASEVEVHYEASRHELRSRFWGLDDGGR
jgi:hypothetical protein